MMQTSTFSS